jgi:predicted alpha/beta superfamily hydrolase
MNLTVIRSILFVLLGIITLSSFGQNIVKEAVFCKELGDTLLFNVWLPYSYEKGKQEYPVLYFHDYGGLSNYGMNVAAELNKRGQDYPKSIVIEFTGFTGSKGNSEHIDFNFYQQGLSAKGEKYLNSLLSDVFPYVKEKYKTSDFRTYLGHSYYASYANLLFTNYPNTFDAYLLFAPESQSEFQENFTLNPKKYDYSNKFFYITTGAKDIATRLALNKVITSKIGSMQDIYFESQIEELADHNAIVDYGLSKSLKFLFHKYFQLSHLDSADLIGSYRREIIVVKKIYKMKAFSPAERYFNLYSLGAQYKDKAFIEYLLANEEEISRDPLHLFNIGYIFIDTFNDRELAAKYYQKSIAVSLLDKTPRTAFNAYSWLGNLYSSDKNYRKAFAILEEGYKTTGSYMLLYQAARLAEHDKSLKSLSRQYLVKIIDNFHGSDLELFGVKLEKVQTYSKTLL